MRLRRPDAEVAASVTLSVVTSEDYRCHGHDAPPEQPPCTIATASGYHHVQDKMDELERQFGDASGGVVSDRIIVLDHSSVDVVNIGGYTFVKTHYCILSDILLQKKMNSLWYETHIYTCTYVPTQVLDVVHPEVPVLDLIDLPGMVTVMIPGLKVLQAVQGGRGKNGLKIDAFLLIIF